VGATERLVLFSTWLLLGLLGAGHVEHPWVRTVYMNADITETIKDRELRLKFLFRSLARSASLLRECATPALTPQTCGTHNIHAT